MLAYGMTVTSFMVYLEPFWEWVWEYDIDLNKLIYKKMVNTLVDILFGHEPV
jgi:hypothetical protein